MKRIAFLYLVFILILGSIVFIRSEVFKNQDNQKRNTSPSPSPSVPLYNASVIINNRLFKVEVAKTQQQQIQGLSDRNSISSDSGMLFVFPQKSAYGFWMKNMKFPIDIIYINDDTIVDIFESVPTPSPDEKSTGLAVYTPLQDANYVLEINAGLSKEYGLKNGDKVIFNDLPK